MGGAQTGRTKCRRTDFMGIEITDRGDHVDVMAERNCNKCARPRNVRLVRNIAGNGTSQVYWYCTFHSGAAGQFIQHEKIKEQGIDIDRLPIIENYSEYFQCAVCGKLGAELHHWAPKHLFGDDAEAYPQSYLCHHHHMRWHDLVTPDMNRREK